MKMKRVLNVFLATALACSMIAAPVFGAPSLEEQKQEAESQVNELQTQLTTLMTKMNDLQNELISKGEQIIQTRAELQTAEEKRQQQYEDMKLRIKYMYESGNESALERILSCGSISDMLVQADYVQSVHQYDRNMLTEYVNTVDEINNLKTTLENDMVILEETQVQYEAQQSELNYTIANKSAEVADLDAQIQEAARIAAEEAARAAKAAEEEEARRQAELANNNNNTNTTSSNNDYDDNTASSPSGGGSIFTPPGDANAAQIIVSAAYSQLGVPYVWGGTAPYVGLDCSGLTQWCHAQAGIYIGRVDSAQLAGGRIVSDPQPGDICWTPGHVAIYIGGGMMIEAQQPGTNICISPVRVSYYVRYW